MNAYHGYVVGFVLVMIVISLFVTCQQPAESYELWEKAWLDQQRKEKL